METISLTSKVLHRLGSIFVGTPESLGMDADFYFDMGDRVQPLPQDIRKRDVLADKLMTNVYRLSLTNRLGLVLSGLCFAVVLGLSLVSVQLTKWGMDIKTKYEAHEVKVEAQHKADAIKALGDITQANCASHLSDINDLSSNQKPIKDWSDDDHALMNFTQNCVAQEFVAASTTLPVQYHVRKFSQTSLGVVGPQTCQAHVADFNALTAKDHWRYSIDPDDIALGSFLSSCQLRGFIRTADMNAPHPVYQ
ncbi:hypothetical protein [Dyella sp. 2HG41-7]|uniref:hypothetical protein n=1 Tax=Dyella sp. 2HG41-7 TaxID=2883239 RepID=UPI001F33F839|nr:hypothetical protein [Dyella sp. 2HG41-7]